jgi:hypothetical protein
VDLLDPVILDALESRVLTDEALLDAAARWKTSLAAEGQSELADRRGSIEARIAKADAAIKHLVGMVARGLAEEADIAGEQRIHMAARDAARDELALLRVPEPLPEVTLADAVRLRVAVRAAWADKPTKVRRAALARVVERVELHPRRVVVQCRPRFGGDDTHHDPSGPPYAPMSFRVPSGSS